MELYYSFSVNDVRYCEYSNELVTEIFNKPEIKKADNEYDKFFSQPLKMLAYCGLISEHKKGRSNVYKILEKDFIYYISLRDRNAYYFLTIYLEKVLKDSDIWNNFNNFFKLQDKNSLYELRDKYVNFIIKNTSINKKLGSKAGNIAEINYNNLLYNQVNWRDIKKDKSMIRDEFNNVFLSNNIDNLKSYKYHIEKTKRFVKAIHKNSEIHRFNSYPATQAHHIFLSSQFPELADIPENIIAITPNQHFYRAHPNNKTSVVDKSYQVICLISKLDTIENDYRNDLDNYSKETFIDIVNIGLGTEIHYTVDFEELKHKIITYYT